MLRMDFGESRNEGVHLRLRVGLRMSRPDPGDRLDKSDVSDVVVSDPLQDEDGVGVIRKSGGQPGDSDDRRGQHLINQFGAHDVRIRPRLVRQNRSAMSTSASVSSLPSIGTIPRIPKPPGD